MARDAKTVIKMPELDKTEGAFQLLLTTTKALNGGIYASASAVFVRDGILTFEVCGDYSEIIKKSGRAARATQKAIDTMHIEAFTPEAIEVIKERVKAFYAAKVA